MERKQPAPCQFSDRSSERSILYKKEYNPILRRWQGARGTAGGKYSQVHRKAWLEVSDPKQWYGKTVSVYDGLSKSRNFWTWESEAEGLPHAELDECHRADQITKRYALSLQRDLDHSRSWCRACTEPDGWIFVLKDDVIIGARKNFQNSWANIGSDFINCFSLEEWLYLRLALSLPMMMMPL